MNEHVTSIEFPPDVIAIARKIASTTGVSAEDYLAKMYTETLKWLSESPAFRVYEAKLGYDEQKVARETVSSMIRSAEFVLRRRAADLIQSWRDADPDEEDNPEDWERLKTAINADRLSNRRRLA